MISFIIPVYNGEKYIERCLMSIINHTKGNYEIIVIDDGSLDTTLEIIGKIKDKHLEIKVFSQRNAGVSSARGAGINMASGEWIVFVDADDYVISDITKIIDQIQFDHQDWIIFSKQFHDSYVLDMNRSEDKRCIVTAILNQNMNNGIEFAKLNTVWSKAYKRSVLTKHGIQFEKKLSHGEDMIFNLDYSMNCNRILCYNVPVYMLCENESSATHRFQKNCVNNDKEFFDQLNKREILNENSGLIECYYRMILNGIWICLGQYFSHPENKKEFKEKRNELSEFLNQEPYKTALKNNYVERNRRKKLMFVLLNLHLYRFALKIVENVRKKSKKTVTGTTII